MRVGLPNSRQGSHWAIQPFFRARRAHGAGAASRPLRRHRSAPSCCGNLPWCAERISLPPASPTRRRVNINRPSHLPAIGLIARPHDTRSEASPRLTAELAPLRSQGCRRACRRRVCGKSVRGSALQDGDVDVDGVGLGTVLVGASVGWRLSSGDGLARSTRGTRERERTRERGGLFSAWLLM